MHGAPDMAGFYTGPELAVDQDTDEPAEDTAAADQDAADAADGGESA